MPGRKVSSDGRTEEKESEKWKETEGGLLPPNYNSTRAMEMKRGWYVRVYGTHRHRDAGIDID